MSDTTPDDILHGLPDRLIDAAELERVQPYSARHCKRLEAAGDFPARVRVGPGRCAWWLSDVMEWAKSLPRHKQDTAA